MMPPYPFKFRPIFKEKLWGGNKIQSVLKKDPAPIALCGESWEISGVKSSISMVREGPLLGYTLPQLIDQYQADLLGKKVYREHGREFPLLVKFIDARQDLSIQVHPGDQLASQRHQSLGKTEMWYILQADPGSKLISGFNRPLDKATYLQHVKEGTLMQILNQEPVQSHDVFFIPAGRVHTIGKGLLLAEIQQTSDITYRIYDFDRVDKNGRKRELHTELALDAIDFHHYPAYKTSYQKSANDIVNLVKCPYFEVNRLQGNRELSRSYHQLDSFVIYVCVEGKFQLYWDGQHITVQKGEVVLVPSFIKEPKLIPAPAYTLLETYIP